MFEIRFWFGSRFWVELWWLDFGERWATMIVLCLWLWLRGGRARLVVAGLWVFFFFGCSWWLSIEKWPKRKVVGGLDCVFFFFFPSSCYRSLWLWMVGQQWKWLLLLCCDGYYVGLVFFFFFPSFVEIFGFGICWCCWCCWSALMLLLLLMIMGKR